MDDVIIIGAGLSGIDCAYRLREQNPDLRYTILERRAGMGGTWDLFRYPGVRSDSDIYTLSYPFEPWRKPQALAQGDDIRHYIEYTARKFGIEPHIRFGRRVVAADWDSAADTWTLTSRSTTSPAARPAARPRPAASSSLPPATTTTTIPTPRSSPAPTTSPVRSCTRSTGRPISITPARTSW